MDGYQNFCLACGNQSPAQYCNNQCEQQGSRKCQCGITIRRTAPQERPYWFRKRRFCSEECRNKKISEHTLERWRDPLVRSRLVRGLRLSQNSDEHIQRARKLMQNNWQNPKFIETFKDKRQKSNKMRVKEPS